jgi:hypothetical protein
VGPNFATVDKAAIGSISLAIELSLFENSWPFVELFQDLRTEHFRCSWSWSGLYRKHDPFVLIFCLFLELMPSAEAPQTFLQRLLLVVAFDSAVFLFLQRPSIFHTPLPPQPLLG